MNANSILEQAGRALQSRFVPLAANFGKGAPAPLLGKLLSLDQLIALRDAALATPHAVSFYESVLQSLRLTWTAPQGQLEEIQKMGPLVIVANHPYGLADGLILGSLLTRVRRDFKFLANPVLAHAVPEGAVLCVNPFEEDEPRAENARALREALRWLSSGGAVIVFPAGEVAALDWSAQAIREPQWKDTAVRLARRAAAPVLPVHIAGSNSVAFHLAGLLNPRLRTALLPRELVNKQGRTIELRVGKPIPVLHFAKDGDPSEITRYVEWRTGLLGARRPNAGMLEVVPPRRERIAEQGDPQAIAREVEALPASALLEERKDLAVFCADAARIPRTLAEIGRLRELTFRGIGEGTGKAADLDRFDRHYQHLFLWNRAKKEVIGAYRVALAHEVLARSGQEGLYTSSLFHLTPDFFRAIGPSVELGRSFVRPEYQKDFAPLMLLWKGIGAFACLHPEVRSLYGAVSISNGYTPESRALMASYLREHLWSASLAALVTAKNPFERGMLSPCPSSSLDHLSEAVEELESDGKGVPVLLRQYLNLNGKAVALHLDRAFSNVVDALVVVELASIPRRAAQRYLKPCAGKEGVPKTEAAAASA